MSLKALARLYGDVSKAIYFNSTTESTRFSPHLSSELCAGTRRKNKENTRGGPGWTAEDTE